MKKYSDCLKDMFYLSHKEKKKQTYLSDFCYPLNILLVHITLPNFGTIA